MADAHSMECGEQLLSNDQISMVLLGAQVLAMCTFDSFSQWNRLPTPLSRHRRCKHLFPIGTARFKKVARFYLKSFFLLVLHHGTPVHTDLFAKTCWERIFAQHYSHCYSGTRKSHQLCSHLLFCMELRPPQARKSHSQKRSSRKQQQ